MKSNCCGCLPASNVQSDGDVARGTHHSTERSYDVDFAGLTAGPLLNVAGRAKKQDRWGAFHIERSHEVEVLFSIDLDMTHARNHDRDFLENAPCGSAGLTEGAGELHHGGVAAQASAKVLRDRAAHNGRWSRAPIAMSHHQTHDDTRGDDNNNNEDTDHCVLTRATDHSAMRATQSEVMADSAWAKPGSIQVVTSTPCARALASIARGCSSGK